jgi:hypothetical protein
MERLAYCDCFFTGARLQMRDGALGKPSRFVRLRRDAKRTIRLLPPRLVRVGIRQDKEPTAPPWFRVCEPEAEARPCPMIKVDWVLCDETWQVWPTEFAEFRC